MFYEKNSPMKVILSATIIFKSNEINFKNGVCISENNKGGRSVFSFFNFIFFTGKEQKQNLKVRAEIIKQE